MIAMARTVNFTAGAMVTRCATRQLANVGAGHDLKDLAALRVRSLAGLVCSCVPVCPVTEYVLSLLSLSQSTVCPVTEYVTEYCVPSHRICTTCIITVCPVTVYVYMLNTYISRNCWQRIVQETLGKAKA